MNNPPLEDIRALLLQVRNTRDIEIQEQQCFLERTRLRPDQLKSLNLANSDLDVDVFTDHDVLFIGGAGEYSAVEDYTWMPGLLELVRQAEARSFPVFGSCWGHQVIARALGGTVIHDLANAELGCLPVFLTSEGQQDMLFDSFPVEFNANMGHHDRVSVLPENAIELARGKNQPNEAFRIKDKPIYGTQFHSELNAERERDRLIRYRPYYKAEMPDEAMFLHIVATLQETTDVDHLMYDFLCKYVARR